jgi:MFS family permease
VRDYLSILAVPRMPALLAASVLARLPMSMNGVAIVLYLQAQTGAFALAGATAGALALGLGVGSVLQSRLIDRRGRRVLLPFAGGHAVALLALVAGGATGWPGAALVLCGLAAGLTLPPTSPVLRSLYPVVLADRPHLRAAAFGLDAAITDLTFVIGPLVVAAFVAALGAAAALVFATTAAVLGTVLFVSVAAELSDVAAGSSVAQSRLGSAPPGIWTLAWGSLGLGFAFGTLEVALPAFAYDAGDAAVAGTLLAVAAGSGVVGGLVYGARRWRRPASTIHLWLAIALPLAVVAPVAGTTALAMAVLVIPTGLLTGPLVASRNELAGQVARPGEETEAYAWPFTSLLVGGALGAAIAGVLIEQTGWRPSLLVATVVVTLVAMVTAARRATLVAPAV